MKAPKYLFSIFLTLGVSLASMTSQAETKHPLAHLAEKSEGQEWLTFEGGEGPGKGKHIVLITADQEYRSEQSFPMMAGILAKHHGFHTTVLFGVNDKGLVDPTMPVYPDKKEPEKFKPHSIPGLDHLATADLVIFKTRLLTLPEDQKANIVKYIDSGKPFIVMRTGNHGFRGDLPYKIEGKQIKWRDVIGGDFKGHHGNWHRDSTRGDIVEAQKDHPILTGVKDIWGPSDVYRTYPEGESLPEGCTALVFGQPLIGRERGGETNPKKIPLPVVWFKNWTTSEGKTARIVHSTMGSAKDLECPGLRRLIINSAYWGLAMEKEISPTSSVEYTGEYKPLASGFAYEKLGVIPQAPSAYRPKAKAE